eukprot:1194750-Prorocentrum_minimum.AAC.5
MLRQLGCKRLVVGHTPQLDGCNATCGGKVWRVDVGMSAGVLNQEAQALEILPKSAEELALEDNGDTVIMNIRRELELYFGYSVVAVFNGLGRRMHRALGMELVQRVRHMALGHQQLNTLYGVFRKVCSARAVRGARREKEERPLYENSATLRNGTRMMDDVNASHRRSSSMRAGCRRPATPHGCAQMESIV